MPRCRIVGPEVERLPLSDGDFIDVRQQLNHGEQEDMYARMHPFVTPGERFQLDSREVRTAKVLAYLVGWSFIDAAGQPIPMGPELPESVRVATLRSLDPESFAEMHAAIIAHEQRTADEAALRKNAPTGAPPSSATSASRK